MLVTKIATDKYELLNAVIQEFQDSRFVLSPEVKCNTVNLGKIRLNKSKAYCGSHPESCDIAGGSKATFLEGQDWVEFNDRLNDALDSINADAMIKSVVCIVRKGKLRRTRYSSVATGRLQEPFVWAKDEPQEHWQDYCNKQAPDSWFPAGTPGQYERKQKV